MRSETGQALLAATGHVSDSGLPLTSLVSRIAAGRGPAATPTPVRALPLAVRSVGVLPAAGLVSAPQADRRLPGGRGGPMPGTEGWTGGVALLAAHGGAGVSCLLRAGLADAGCVDGRRRWPSAGPVLLVARTNTGGLEWARDLARQHASGHAGLHVQLVGLVLVADAPGRLPARIAALADLVCGAFVRCWQVPWLTEWRLAAATEPLPAPPEVARLSTDLLALAAVGPALPAHPSRPDRSRGALL